MADISYQKDLTALLVIDPYNDFISEGGKIWDRIKDVAEANQCVPHMALRWRQPGVRGSVSAMRSITVTAAVIMRPGNTWSRFKRQVSKARSSQRAHGVARSEVSSSRNQATLWPKSIGVPAGLRTPTWKIGRASCRERV